MISTALLLQLACSCAPNVASDTIFEIVKTESNFNEFAVNVNAPRHKFKYKSPQNLIEAVAVVNAALAKGYSVDIGLMQVNTQHLSRFNSSIIEAFDPCNNIRMGSNVLTEFYAEAITKYNPDFALLATLSAYNTGNFHIGFENGYVSKYLQDNIQPETEEKIMNADTTVDLSTLQDREKGNEIERVLKEAELQGVAVRQDIADDMGFFEETAISKEDAIAAQLDNED